MRNSPVAIRLSYAGALTVLVSNTGIALGTGGKLLQ